VLLDGTRDHPTAARECLQDPIRDHSMIAAFGDEQIPAAQERRADHGIVWVFARLGGRAKVQFGEQRLERLSLRCEPSERVSHASSPCGIDIRITNRAGWVSATVD